MQWYLDGLYLNHGYHFFAPSPGPGHIIRYELFDDRGSVIGQGEFPNTKDQWPRLRYHRHFMLTEQAELPSENAEDRQHWQRVYLESYARHLLRINPEAQSVRLRRIAHWPIPRQFAAQGRKLTDPEGYETVMEITLPRSNVDAHERAQSGLWTDRQVDTANRQMGGMR